MNEDGQMYFDHEELIPNEDRERLRQAEVDEERASVRRLLDDIKPEIERLKREREAQDRAMGR